jgi:biopolymer transport protein ExbB/TolQ
MRTRTIALITALGVFALWLVFNRRLLAVQTDVSLFFGSISTSVGALLLGTVAIMALLFVGYIALWQRMMLRDYRAQTKELESQRRLADNAEASRFTELTTLLRSELAQVRSGVDASLATLRTDLREIENAVAATVGELEDRLERGAVLPSGEPPVLVTPVKAKASWFSKSIEP